MVSAFFPTPDGVVGPAAADRGARRRCSGSPRSSPWSSPGARAAAAPSRIVAGTRVLSAITALPAFFVDVPALVKLLVAVVVVLTVVSVVLVLAPARRAATVTD